MSEVDPSLSVDEFDYDLPPERIAQTPLRDRSGSRLMVIDRARGAVTHRHITDLPTLLCVGDLVVVNNTRVHAARLHGRRASGGRVELLLLRRETDGWLAMARPSRRLRDGETIAITAAAGQGSGDMTATVTGHHEEGLVVVSLSDALDRDLERIGTVPLPPYIHARLDDPERYQTVYATELGSAAAPTAGLHLTEELLDEVRARGIGVVHVTLHVGLDTFRPVSVERVADHRIHTEWCEVTPTAAAALIDARSRGGRVIAVGTTSARTLETWGRAGASAQAGWSGWTDIFITPGYRWTVVDGLLTNFHLPRSTLLMMVSALAGTDVMRAAYAEAIATEYRFFSFGDAQLIL